VLGWALTTYVQFYDQRPDPRVPRASFVDDGANLGPTHSLPFRSSLVDELVTSIHPSVRTLADLWKYNVRRFGASECLGKRSVVRKLAVASSTTNKDGSTTRKELTKLILSPTYTWETYNEVDAKVVALSKFLTAELDRAAPRGGGRPRHAGIYASTSPQWQTTSQACFRAGVTLGTVYATLGPAGLAYAAHLTDMTVLFVEPEAVRHVADVMKAGPYMVDDGEGAQIACTNLRNIRVVVVVNGGKSECRAEDLATLENRTAELGGGIRVLTFDEAVHEGRAIAGVEIVDPQPDDCAVIMFTSGSTGLPKGVEVLHRNLVGVVAGLANAVPGIGHADYYLAYLPLAHILELAAELMCLAVGAKLGYGHAFTLTDNSPMIAQVGDSPDVPPEGVRGDATALRPTVLAGVPAVYDKVRKRIATRFANETGLRKFLWDSAWAAKTKVWGDYGLTPFWDALLFDKVRTMALGGRVRVMISGGGPISKETQHFMNIVFNCPVGQGYGLTETCGGGTVFWADDRSLGRAGVPIPSNDLKLVDWEEGGYTVRTSRDNPVPSGEICIAGENVTKGYYQLPEKTAEAFKEEGGRVWFYTGDIGAFDADGWLRIVDRKKDLVKLIRGEYIALGKIETVAKLADVVTNFCAYGDSEKEYSVGLCVVNKEALPQHLAALHEDDLVGNAEAGAFVQAQIAKFGKGRLSKEEIPAKVYVVGCQEWLPPSGLVTASLKLQRRPIQQRFKAELESLYREAPGASGAAGASE
jgi:long-chain acyl-CoA synthetase